ncbi:glycine betaine ABC transporter substrate-binding protein [Taklimakanibacter deserti]|uniref:glycine betaine ABC transporter substrate-binding protein n=1 Tax=Taklimakanibacter deserti TaxID=2267839 RepID=UPI000E64AD2A
MLKLIMLAGISFLLLTSAAAGKEPDSCRAPRIADGGWTDNTAQNALAMTVLRHLGYEPKDQLLSVPVILESLKNKQIDIWLDNWMPSQTTEVRPYLDAKTIESFAVNLEGAGYGPVVPAYVAEAGVRSLADLAAQGERFGRKMYGIEPGNDGNRILQGKIDDPANGLKDWSLVESSEQGMLAQAEKELGKKNWIIFLAWTPHPVMGKMPISYLSGFEKDGFGPATIHTLVRSGYGEECANVARFLKNLKFTVEMEGAVMEDILANKDAAQSATMWLTANPGVLDQWLAGVTAWDGSDGKAAVLAKLK